MSDELKPCPFCKSDAKTWKQGIVRQKMVACSNDECGAFFSKNGFTVEEWNTRTDERAEMQAAIVELRELLRNAKGCMDQKLYQNLIADIETTLNNTKKWSEHDQ